MTTQVFEELPKLMTRRFVVCVDLPVDEYSRYSLKANPELTVRSSRTELEFVGKRQVVNYLVSLPLIWEGTYDAEQFKLAIYRQINTQLGSLNEQVLVGLDTQGHWNGAYKPEIQVSEDKPYYHDDELRVTIEVVVGTTKFEVKDELRNAVNAVERIFPTIRPDSIQKFTNTFRDFLCEVPADIPREATKELFSIGIHQVSCRVITH